MMDQESNQQQPANEKAIFEEVNGGKFPILKMMELVKAGKQVNLKMKGMKVSGGARFKHNILEPKSKGGGVIMFVVGASRWELKFAFDDLEMEEAKEILIYGS